jgi:hypothetical protein
MKLDTKAMAISTGALWGGAVLATALINVAKPTYGKEFLRMVESIYPGYRATRGPKHIVIGAAYAFLDGAMFGAAVSAIYNCLESGAKEESRSLRAA